MSTLHQVAKATGLSVSSVSEILRDKPGYQPATRKRVQAAARRLHYQPSTAARQLRSGRSGLLGVLLKLDPPAANVARLAALEHAARAGGFRLVLGQASEGRELAEFLAGGLDGVFWLHPTQPGRRTLPAPLRSIPALVVADRIADASGPMAAWAGAAMALMTRLLDGAPKNRAGKPAR
jgi:DNA-binding LacI/PurR family transcriptional regulator